MAYGKSSLPFLLKEGFLSIGLWPNPTLLTPNNNPVATFQDDGDVGYFKQGTSKLMLERQYAEFLAGTPGKVVRKDLVLKRFTISAMFAQFDQDRLALAQGLDVELGQVDIAWIGSDEPGGTVSPTGFNGYLLTTQLTDGQPFFPAMWYGKDVSESVGWELSGTEHGTYEILLQSFEHPAYQDNPDDTHNYGAIFFDNASSN